MKLLAPALIALALAPSAIGLDNTDGSLRNDFLEDYDAEEDNEQRMLSSKSSKASKGKGKVSCSKL